MYNNAVVNMSFSDQHDMHNGQQHQGGRFFDMLRQLQESDEIPAEDGQWSQETYGVPAKYQESEEPAKDNFENWGSFYKTKANVMGQVAANLPGSSTGQQADLMQMAMDEVGISPSPSEMSEGMNQLVMVKHDQVHMQYDINQEVPVQFLDKINNMKPGTLNNKHPQQVETEHNQPFVLQDCKLNNVQAHQSDNTNMQQFAQNDNFNIPQFTTQNCNKSNEILFFTQDDTVLHRHQLTPCSKVQQQTVNQSGSKRSRKRKAAKEPKAKNTPKNILQQVPVPADYKVWETHIVTAEECSRSEKNPDSSLNLEPTLTKEHKKWQCEKRKCTEIGRVFNTEDELKIPEETHNRKPRHQCPHCNYKFYVKWHLDNHLIKEHKELQQTLDKQLKYTYGNCHNIFPTEAVLKQHYSISHKSEFTQELKLKAAQKVEIEFGDGTETKNDTQPDAKEEQKIKVNPVNGTAFLCDQGDHKPFAHKSSLAAHMAKHKENPSFKCEYCSKTFWHKSSFRSHFCNQLPSERTRNKPNRKRKLYECTTCGKSFRGNTNHKNHMLAHEGKYKYECNVCGKPFNNPFHYKAHMDRHYQVKRFQCEKCDHSTVSKLELKQHMRQHTGVKPYKCKYCDRRFTHNSNCRVHERRMHNKEHVQVQQQMEHDEQLNHQRAVKSNGQLLLHALQPEQLQMHQKQHLEQQGETHLMQSEQQRQQEENHIPQLPHIQQDKHHMQQQRQRQMCQYQQQKHQNLAQMHQEQHQPQPHLRLLEGGFMGFYPEYMQLENELPRDQHTAQRQQYITKRHEQTAEGQHHMDQTQQHIPQGQQQTAPKQQHVLQG